PARCVLILTHKRVCAYVSLKVPPALVEVAPNTALTELLGKDFTDSYLSYKRNEVERFQRHVTDWEFTEYAYHL
ncbi:hypothetical protein ACFV23_24090, partial [Streptomyces sp. NPDC059627]